VEIKNKRRFIIIVLKTFICLFLVFSFVLILGNDEEKWLVSLLISLALSAFILSILIGAIYFVKKNKYLKDKFSVHNKN